MAVELINPCGIYDLREAPLAPRRPLSEAKCIGLLSNLKANADRFLDEVGKRLKQRFPHLEFEVFQKIASRPADFDERWLSRVHAVAAAFGD